MIPRSETTAQPRFIVRFYNHAKRGTWTRTFSDRAKAEEFAQGKTLYAKPAVVEQVSR